MLLVDAAHEHERSNAMISTRKTIFCANNVCRVTLMIASGALKKSHKFEFFATTDLVRYIRTPADSNDQNRKRPHQSISSNMG